MIAVVSGAGLEDVFHSLGTNAVIRGGQTMNPSCAQIVEAINSVASDKVLVLPNNKNVLPAATLADVHTKAGDPIGLVDGSIRVASQSVNEAVERSLDMVDTSHAEIISMYYGDDTTGDEAAGLSRMLKERYPRLEFEVIPGGQPHYSYIISVE